MITIIMTIIIITVIITINSISITITNIFYFDYYGKFFGGFRIEGVWDGFKI